MRYARAFGCALAVLALCNGIAVALHLPRNEASTTAAAATSSAAAHSSAAGSTSTAPQASSPTPSTSSSPTEPTASVSDVPSATADSSIESNTTASTANNEQAIYTGGQPIHPQITPGLAIVGVVLLAAGTAYCMVGIKIKRLQIFLSSAFLSALGVTVLVVYVMNPPVSNAIQGAYVAATIISGIVVGGLACVFPEVTEGLGCLLGGFCLSMWFLVLKPGGLITSTYGKLIIIAVCSLGVFILAFHRVTRPYGLIFSLSFAGATALVLGIDCFSRAGLKEFWLYIWSLNDRMFPINTDTYPHTRGIRVEIAVIVLVAALGIMSQVKLFKLVLERRALKEADKRRHEADLEAQDDLAAQRVVEQFDTEKAEWEASYGNKDYNQDERPSTAATSKADSGIGDDAMKSKDIVHEEFVETEDMKKERVEHMETMAVEDSRNHSMDEQMNTIDESPDERLAADEDVDEIMEIPPVKASRDEMRISAEIQPQEWYSSSRRNSAQPSAYNPNRQSAEVMVHEVEQPVVRLPPPTPVPRVIPLPLPRLPVSKEPWDSDYENSEGSSMASCEASDATEDMKPVEYGMQMERDDRSSLAATCDDLLDADDEDLPKLNRNSVLSMQSLCQAQALGEQATTVGKISPAGYSQETEADKQEVDVESSKVASEKEVQKEGAGEKQAAQETPVSASAEEATIENGTILGVAAHAGELEPLPQASVVLKSMDESRTTPVVPDAEPTSKGKSASIKPDRPVSISRLPVSTASLKKAKSVESIESERSGTTSDLSRSPPLRGCEKRSDTSWISQKKPARLPENLAPASTRLRPKSNKSLQSGSTPTSESHSSTPQFDAHCSKVVNTYRTNEWAKHLADAEPPEVPADLPTLDEEKPAPLHIEALQETATVTPVDNPRRRSRSTASSKSVEHARQKSVPHYASPLAPRKSSQTMHPASDTIAGSPSEEKGPAIHRRATPMSFGGRNTTTPFSNNTLMGQRESIVRNKSSMLGLDQHKDFRTHTPGHSADLPRSATPMAFAGQLNAAHRQSSLPTLPRPGGSPAPGPLVSRASNARLSGTSIALDDDMPLSSRKELLQSSMSQQSILPQSQTRRRVVSQQQIARSDPHLMKTWRDSIKADLQLENQAKSVSYADQRRVEMVKNRNQAAMHEKKKTMQETYKDEIMGDRMRQQDMLELHKEALRKMQASANKHLY